MRPLDKIVVLDLTRLLPGAFATQILTDFGAETIKVEEPSRGDPGRRLPPLHGNKSKIFSLTNKGKKSIAINLKDPRGKRAFLRLVSRADVLIESFRPGVMARLGLSYAELSRRNPRLIYAAISGYGQTGSNAALPGHDLNYVSRSGLLALMRSEGGSPLIPPIQIADLVGGALQAVVGILLALLSRSVTGRGQMVDAAMTDGIIPLLVIPMASRTARQRQHIYGGLLTGSFACYNVYKASDATWISVGALEPKFWRLICERLECKEFISAQFADARKQSQMIAKLSQIIRKRSAGDWFALLKDACVTPVEGLSRKQPGIWPALSRTPGKRRGNVPRLGQHTREIFAFAAFTSKEIQELERIGVAEQDT